MTKTLNRILKHLKHPAKNHARELRVLVEMAAEQHELAQQSRLVLECEEFNGSGLAECVRDGLLDIEAAWCNIREDLELALKVAEQKEAA